MNFETFLFMILLCLSIEYSVRSDPLKKNVIVIVADDLGWNDLSFHGSNQFPTPNIDALAYSGITLQNYYVMPLCSPSRSALMSGMHPIRTGMYHRPIEAPQPAGLPLDVKILPQYLKDYGYRTHIVGKWHLGFCKAVYTPTRRGFDSHFGFWAAHEDYYSHVDVYKTNITGYDLRRNMDSVPLEYQGQYSTDIFTTEAVNIIDSHDLKDPLFLYLAHQAVHTPNMKSPLQAPQDIIDKFNYIADKKRRTFAAMVWKLDESVGKVVQALARKNMLENTMIVFTTDNGGATEEFHGNAASNWPLKGMKGEVWEGGVRGAAFIWSADLPHFAINNALMHIQDWLPTILGAIDNQVNSTSADLNGLDGRNMWPVLKGEKPSEYDELLLQKDEIDGVGALRNKNWKVIHAYKFPYNEFMQYYSKSYGPSGRDVKYAYNITDILRSPTAEVLQTEFPFPEQNQILSLRRNISLNCDYCGINNKLCTPCIFRNGPCLFDISNDPCERNNLAKKYPNVLQDMLNRLERYKPVPAIFPTPSAEANPKYWNNTWTNWLDYASIEHIIIEE